MIRITKTAAAQLKSDAELGAHHYQMATQEVIFQGRVESLSAYLNASASTTSECALDRLVTPTLLSKETAQLRYHGEAPFAGKLQEVHCWYQGQIIQLDIAGQPACGIDLENQHIHLFSAGDFDERQNLELVTGPAMMLVLAAQGIYCLHAGCVATPMGTIALMAESGVGKSTLSAHCDTAWRQLADDILPLQLVGAGNQYQALLGQYPQLKLNNAQVAQPAGEALQLDLLVRLVKQPVSQVECKPLTKPAGMLQVIRHTVAAKLFTDQMLRAHTHIAKRLTSRVPIIEVAYPRDISLLPQLRKQLTDYLESVSLGA